MMSTLTSDHTLPEERELVTRSHILRKARKAVANTVTSGLA